MSHPLSLTKLLSVALMGILVTAAFVLVLAPAPSLYAG